MTCHDPADLLRRLGATLEAMPNGTAIDANAVGQVLTQIATAAAHGRPVVEVDGVVSCAERDGG